MNFTSLSTVYASLTIAAATFLSTYFPAKSAMEIAKPTEDAGWSLPKPENDTLAIELPFTFTNYDRIAVLGFFHSFFENHGEGSSGPFFAGPSRLGVSERMDPLAENAYIPMLDVTVWLKPFDLGVSQRVVIELFTDAATQEKVAHITLVRQTGTVEAWNRLNKPFISRVRNHFLHWRAVTDESKQEYFVQARSMMRSHMSKGERRDG